MRRSFIGAVVGAATIYAILRLGKLLFGRQRVKLPMDTKIVFTETSVHLPDKEIPYEELFYRKSDVIVLRARTLELVDRGYQDVLVRLSPSALEIGGEKIDPETVAVHGSRERGNHPAARGDGIGRREIHGRDWRVHRLAGRVFFADAQFDDWRGGRA